MTYEESKEYILQNWFDGNENTDSVVDGDDETFAMITAIEALEKAEKNQWHDLRKDPNDLPKTSGLSYVPCLILREYNYSLIPEYAEYEYFEGYGWGFCGIDYKSIKAWKYFELEQFEVEE